MPLVSLYRDRSGIFYLRYGESLGLNRRSLRTRDKQLAEAIRSNEEHRFLLGEYGIQSGPAQRIRLSVFIKLFIEYKRGQGRAENSLIAYFHALNNFGTFLERDEFLHKITLQMIEEFAASRRKLGRAEKTIRNELVTLCTAFKWAQRQRYMVVNPSENLQLPRRIKNPPRYLHDKEYRRLRRVIVKPEWRDIIDFYLLTGLRRADGLRILSSQHIDLEKGIVYLPQQKTKDFQPFAISPDLRPIIRRMVSRAEAAGEDRIIPLKEDTLTFQFRRYVKKARLPANITFHALRHTFATRLAALGTPLTAIQRLLGHSEPQSTAVYVHAFENQSRDALNALRLPGARRKAAGSR